jgi:hypothetical protein
MAQPIHTYFLRGLDAIPAEVLVDRDRVRVVERQTRRTLHEVKREPSSSAPAGVQSDGPNLVRRESAPETVSTSRLYLFMAGKFPNHIGPGLDHRFSPQRVPINHRNKP